MKKYLQDILKLPKIIKKLILIFLDLSAYSLSVFISFYIYHGSLFYIYNISLTYIAFSTILFFVLANFFGLYNSIIRFSGIKDIEKIFKVFFILFIIMLISLNIHKTDLKFNFLIFQILISLLLITLFRRLSIKLLNLILSTNLLHRKVNKILIYGAGQAGRQLSNLFLESNYEKVVGFIDDNLNLQSRSQNNISIYGPSEIESLVKKNNISKIIIAIPSIKKEGKNRILKRISRFNIPISTLPDISDITKNIFNSTDLLNLNIEDLLGRKEISPDRSLLGKNIKNKVVLITGAGGSIGSELCRQIIKLQPRKVLLLDNSEFSLFSIYHEISSNFTIKKDFKAKIVPILCSINNKEDLNRIFIEHSPLTVFHAAAYKHVDLVEKNISYAVQNNIFGTLNLFEVCIKFQISNFTFVSTDKAVRSTNIMGSTKRICELILQGLSKKNPKIKLSIVRFGNVLGSSGSVVPIFKDQIKKGGPVTVSHKDVERYFMSISEAVQLVIQASSIFQKNGNVFYLDMGQPLKIFDLAKKMINLSGYRVNLDKEINNDNEMKIIFTGLKRGEKMFEELVIDGNPENTQHPRIFSVRDSYVEWSKLFKKLKLLKEYTMKHEDKNIIRLIKEIDITYKPITY